MPGAGALLSAGVVEATSKIPIRTGILEMAST